MHQLRAHGAVYTIEKVAGQGGSATVFRALREDNLGHSQQTVALKILRTETAVPWLRREFETLAQINSPHCVRVLGWENLDEGCALVLEWIDGVSLLDFGRWQSISEELVYEILAQALAGLRALHEAGLHHGDLSPNNILIDRQGCVRLVDFATAPNEANCVRGTAPYLAPELWFGESPNRASDLFAAGLIEHDMQNGFSVPDTAKECQARALALATTGRGLLAHDPEMREAPHFSSQPEVRRQLARRVGRLLEARNQTTMVTAQISQNERDVNWSARIVGRIAGMIVSVFMTAVAPVRAQAPIKIVEPSAVLEIRSQNWLEVSIDGRSVGYTPLVVRDLSAGPHQVIWKSRILHGHFEVRLQPGEVRKLTGDGLIAMSHNVNR